MGIFKKALHSKIDVFVKFESAINLEIRGQIFKNFIKYCMYVCCWNKCENVHCIFNFIFFNPICEKTRNNTLLNFLYVLVNP